MMKYATTSFLFLLLTSVLIAQTTYYVSKDGTGNFSSISQVNSASLQPGDIVSFQGGSQFSDAVLLCKEGVTYTSYGSSKSTIGDSLKTISDNASIQIDVLNVSVIGLKVYAYKNSISAIAYSKGNLTITDCEIIGGYNAHNLVSAGIYQTTSENHAGFNVTILRNRIRGFGEGAIYWARPFNYEIGYNELFDIWRVGAYANKGGKGISRRTHIDTNNPPDYWDCGYTVRIHHNNIHSFEKAAFMGYSRMLIEYNEIHNNLDERIYRGGVKHGSVGKIWDNTHTTGIIFGGLGIVFRYNYVHDLIGRGLAGKVYSLPNHNDNNRTASDYYTGIYTGTVTTNSSYVNAVYKSSGKDGLSDFGDEPGETPDAVLSGFGHGEYWIHNNVFYNCSNAILNKSSANGLSPSWDVIYSSYFLNNTIINCGWRSFATEYGGLIIVDKYGSGGSPLVVENNIFDFTSIDARATLNWRDRSPQVSHNIYLNDSGYVSSVPAKGSNRAAVFRDDAAGYIPQNEYYKIEHQSIWIDTSSSFFAPNIGIAGVNMPDLRLRLGSTAQGTGKPYNTLGNDYTIGGTNPPYWSETHTVGQDPAGRSFAYDMLGNLRATYDIGAFGIVASSQSNILTGLKVFIEAAFLNGSMNSTFSTLNLLPTQQPYNTSPWNINDNNSISSLDTTFVDWVLIQLRADSSTTNYSKPGILASNGFVVNTDGSPFRFSSINSGEYYIVIRHRNHLDIMSSEKVFVQNNTKILYDFTTGLDKIWGTNSLVEVESGKFAMIAGDGDANGVVNVLDFSTVANNILFYGYSQGDIDMNGVINVLDYAFISRNTFKASQVP